MERFILQLKEELESSLREVERTEIGMLQRAEQCINLLEQGFDKLKSFILSYTFKDETEEITFFKELKPQLFCRLLFYRKLYYIELDKPTGGREVLKAYLEKKLSYIRDYYDNATDFYHYYRSGSTHMDHLFFLRGKHDIRMNIERFYFERDPQFSTSHDFMVAKILSNKMLEEYLQRELEQYTQVSSAGTPLRVKLTWTAKKIFLTELSYALYLAKVFNHGKATLREIKSYFEDVFNIDLGANPYKGYSEMRERKTPSAFISMLKNILTKKMNDDDNK